MKNDDMHVIVSIEQLGRVTYSFRTIQPCGIQPSLVTFKSVYTTRAHKNRRLVRACNYVKIESGRNFPPILKIVTNIA